MGGQGRQVEGHQTVVIQSHSGQEDQLGEGVGRNVLDIVGLEVDVLEARKETHR